MDDLTNMIYAYFESNEKATLAGLNLKLMRQYDKPIKQIEIYSRLVLLLDLYEDREEYEKCSSINGILKNYENKSTKNI